MIKMLLFHTTALLCLFLLSAFGGADAKPRQASNATNDSDTAPVVNEVVESSSVTSLEDALAVLNNLSTSQKLMWEQQQVREEELRRKTQDEIEREAQRTKALQEEHRILQEMKGKVSRKLRAMSKPPPPYSGNGQGSQNNGFFPRDCADIYLDAEETSGVYRVWPNWDRTGNGFLVYCDMDTDGGGWTVIRRWGNNRFSTEFFKKSWSEYKRGFGDIRGDFWLGNEQINQLTNQAAYQLRFDIQEDFSNLSTTYQKFWIEDSSRHYKLHVEELLPLSTAGHLLENHDNVPFSTSDANHVKLPPASPPRYGYSQPASPPECSLGWWFKSDCTLNKYLDPRTVTSEPRPREMKIRPVLFSKLRESS